MSYILNSGFPRCRGENFQGGKYLPCPPPLRNTGTCMYNITCIYTLYIYTLPVVLHFSFVVETRFQICGLGIPFSDWVFWPVPCGLVPRWQEGGRGWWWWEGRTAAHRQGTPPPHLSEGERRYSLIRTYSGESLTNQDTLIQDMFYCPKYTLQQL